MLVYKSVSIPSPSSITKGYPQDEARLSRGLTDSPPLTMTTMVLRPFRAAHHPSISPAGQTGCPQPKTNAPSSAGATLADCLEVK